LFTENLGSDTFLRSINPDGTNQQTLATYDSTVISAIAANPNATNDFAFGFITTGTTTTTMQLFRGNSTLEPTTSTLLTATVFDSIDKIMFSADGSRVFFLGSVPSSSVNLFSIPSGGGVPTLIATGVADFAVAPTGTGIAYILEGDQQIYRRADVGSPEIQVTTGTLVHTGLNFNRAADRLLYSHSVAIAGGDVREDLGSVALDGTGITNIFSTTLLGETGASYNPDASEIAYIVSAVDSSGVQIFANSGLFKASAVGANPTQLVVGNGFGGQTYWTNAAGRLSAGQQLALSLRKKRK
jgi:hypothetical protein